MAGTPTSGTSLYILLQLLGASVFLLLAAVSTSNGWKKESPMLFSAICFFGFLINLDVALVSLIKDEAVALQVDRIIYLCFIFTIPVYVRFVHSFLFIDNRRILEAGAFVVSMALLLFSQTDYFIRGFHEYFFGRIARAGPAYIAFSAAAGIAVVYCLITLVESLRTPMSNTRRNRIKIVIIGMGTSTLLIALNALPVSGIEIYPPGNFSVFPAVILAFGVLKYDLFDLGSVIRKSAFYGVLAGMLALVYVMIITSFNLFFMDTEKGNPLVLSFILALCIVFIFNPLRDRVQDFVDVLFFRGRYGYQKRLRDISSMLTKFLTKSDIAEHLLAMIVGSLDVRSAVLAVRGDGNAKCTVYRRERSKGIVKTETFFPDDIAEYFQNRKSPITRTDFEKIGEDVRFAGISEVFRWTDSTILIPVIAEERLRGLIAAGEKMSGGIFGHEEKELFTTVANQTALALENAGRYEEIEMLNRNLERIIEERTKELKDALDEKIRTQEQLVRSESLAAIGQLVAGVAHELNNPLAGASSLVESTIESLRECGSVRSGDEKEVIDDLSFSLKELQRAGNIVKSLLGLSRQTDNYIEPVDVNAVIDDALRVLYNQYKYLDIRIEKEYEENLPRIDGNFAALGQVFINVVKNSIQATRKGEGIVKIVTTFDAEQDEVCIECENNGASIDEEVLPHIFKPFFTTKNPGEGTGLGLYIAHEIVTRHHGTIQVRRSGGEGTVASITLPKGRKTV